MEGGSRAGFVLVGGRSSRMRRDKALLPAGSRTRPEQIADAVRRAVGNVAAIGGPEKYAPLGLPVADAGKGWGPMGGIYTAALHAKADGNLVGACDMPGVTANFPVAWIGGAGRSARRCVACATPGGIEPLWAVYHPRLLPALKSALQLKQLKMKDFLLRQKLELWPVAEGAALRNEDTPELWRQEVA
jgi:molybdopterin-guanine dinucleotide biosynthesis protein A